MLGQDVKEFPKYDGIWKEFFNYAEQFLYLKIYFIVHHQLRRGFSIQSTRIASVDEITTKPEWNDVAARN